MSHWENNGATNLPHLHLQRPKGCDRGIVGKTLVVDLAFFEPRFQKISAARAE
jgi:hypothetical protein